MHMACSVFCLQVLLCATYMQGPRRHGQSVVANWVTQSWNSYYGLESGHGHLKGWQALRVALLSLCLGCCPFHSGQRLGVGSVSERPGGVCPWLWGVFHQA